MQAVERSIQWVARTSVPVLIAGERGTGRRTLAMRIHQISAGNGFFQFDCGTLLPEHLRQIAQILATESHASADQERRTDTLYLREIGELPSAAQAILLQHLVGDGSTGSTGVRIITSTSHGLETELAERRLSEDLYHRLNGVSLHIPPLRSRKEDIPVFISRFLRTYLELFVRTEPILTDSQLQALVEYGWPGNLGELENVVRAMVASGSIATALKLLQAFHGPEFGRTGELAPLKRVARAASLNAQRELIATALARTRWNRKLAAEQLQISYKALLYKLKEVGLVETPQEQE